MSLMPPHPTSGLATVSNESQGGGQKQVAGKFLGHWHGCILASFSLDLEGVEGGSRSGVGVSRAPPPVPLLVAQNCRLGDLGCEACRHSSLRP